MIFHPLWEGRIAETTILHSFICVGQRQYATFTIAERWMFIYFLLVGHERNLTEKKNEIIWLMLFLYIDMYNNDVLSV